MEFLRFKNMILKIIKEANGCVRVEEPLKMWIPKSVLIIKEMQLPKVPSFFVKNERERYNTSYSEEG